MPSKIRVITNLQIKFSNATGYVYCEISQSYLYLTVSVGPQCQEIILLAKKKSLVRVEC